MSIAKTSLLSLVVCLAGCMSLTPESRIPLLADELALMKAHKDVVILPDGALKNGKLKFTSETPKDKHGFFVGSFRYRLLNHSKALKLTPDEISKLSSPGEVALCGKCGNLKGRPNCRVPDAKTSSATDYAKDSLIDRILGY
ncbi:MAG: hypothetical protein GXP32_07015 [Kiritimatiellaeota bacterium]|nr:hypothetical protein [Kiritimatiellota bacterium]